MDPLIPFYNILREADIFGSIGTQWFTPRSNLLVDIVDVKQDVGQTLIYGKVMQAQGASYMQFRDGIFPKIPDQELGVLPVEVQWKNDLITIPKEGKCLLWDVAEQFPTTTAHWTFDEASKLFPLQDQFDGPIRIVEMFSGGHGGWAYGAKFLRTRQCFEQTNGIQIMAVDHDWFAVANYATTHGAIMIDGTKPIPLDIMSTGRDVAICADINGDHWQQVASCWRPDICTISAPCIPWSTAGRESGLASELGRLLAEAIVICKRIRPKLVAIEQVPGFFSHEHAKHIINQLKASGYSLIFSQVVDANSYGCTSRRRWLCIACLNNDQAVAPKLMTLWREKTPSTPQDMDSIVAWNHHELELLRIPQKALDLGMKAELLPPSMRMQNTPSGQATLAKRCADGLSPLQTFMAMYGSQHEIDQTKMKQKGYLAHFYRPTNEEPRFWHPLEIALHHVIWECAFVGPPNDKSWKFKGNQIAMPHALYVLANCMNQLKKSPKVDVDDIMQDMWNSRLRASVDRIIRLQHGCAIVDSNSPTAFRFEGQFEQHFEALQQRCSLGCFEGGKAWEATIGMFDIDDCHKIFMETQNVDHLSVITVPSINEDHARDTQAFACMQRAKISTQDGSFSCWFENTMPTDQIINVWTTQMTLQILEENQCAFGSVVELKYENPIIPNNHEGVEPILFIQDATMNLYENPKDQDMKSTIEKWSIHKEVFDQFGPIKSNQTSFPKMMCVCFDTSQALEPDTQGTHIPLDAATVMAAMWQSESVEFSGIQDFSFGIEGTGDRPVCQALAKFWSNVLPPSELQEYGYVVSEEVSSSKYRVVFSAVTTTNPMPRKHIWIRLVVQATRFIFASLHDDNGIMIKIKWIYRSLWIGKLPQDMTADQIINLLTVLLKPVLQDAIPRLVHAGKRCHGDFRVADMTPKGEEQIVTCHVVPSLQGGGGKESNKTQAKNSIAATLLENGFDLHWVSETTEKIISAAGLKKASQTAQLPGGQHRIDQVLALCKECGIAIPATQQQKSQRMVAHVANQKARKGDIEHLNPSNYVIEPGFLQNADGTDALQISQVRSMATGICIMTPNEATPWLRENQTISKDELGIFILGHLNQSTDLPNIEVHVPCRNQTGQQVILAGTLVQLGAKKLQVSTKMNHDMTLKNCQTVALTVWKEDWTESDWLLFIKSTGPTFRKFLGAKGSEESIIGIWGRSLRHQNKPADARFASSIQVHCTVPDDALQALLVKSGFCKIYATPKNDIGKFDERWRIIWVPGDLAHVTGIAAKTNACSGLIRGKAGYGLRFAKDHFEAAWRVINPSEVAPVQIGGEHLFKIEPLPYGCTSSILQEWAKKQNWEVKPVKAIGPKTWILAAADHPPPGVLLFNGNPIITHFIVPKNGPKSKVIVAGPRPKLSDTQSSQPSPFVPNPGNASDPWAQYFQQKGVAVGPTRAPDGPIETQFKQQETRLATLEKSLQDMQEAQKQQATETKANFEKAEQRDKETKEYVVQALETTKRDIQQSVETALVKQASTLNNSLDELKALFKMQNKRARSEDDADMAGL